MAKRQIKKYYKIENVLNYIMQYFKDNSKELGIAEKNFVTKRNARSEKSLTFAIEPISIYTLNEVLNINSPEKDYDFQYLGFSALVGIYAGDCSEPQKAVNEVTGVLQRLLALSMDLTNVNVSTGRDIKYMSIRQVDYTQPIIRTLENSEKADSISIYVSIVGEWQSVSVEWQDIRD